jgi:hypothetical protein
VVELLTAATCSPFTSPALQFLPLGCSGVVATYLHCNNGPFQLVSRPYGSSAEASTGSDQALQHGPGGPGCKGEHSKPSYYVPIYGSICSMVKHVSCCWLQVPLSSANPKFEAMLHNKPRLIVLNKADIADQRLVQVSAALWVQRTG